jgi:hypothetical protein
MTQQLALGGIGPIPSKRLDSRDDVCRCGHSRDHHADGRGTCTFGLGARHGGCGECRRFRPKKRAPMVVALNFLPPAGAVEWFRGPPELVRRKVGGWFLGGDRRLLVYLALSKSSKLESLNVHSGGFTTTALAAQLHAADANRRKSHTLRTVAALEQAGTYLGAVLDKLPSRITITRISCGRLDDDNLIGAAKGIRDGVAEAFNVDDKIFSVAGQDPAAVALFYQQATPGQREVYGAQLELVWEA